MVMKSGAGCGSCCGHSPEVDMPSEGASRDATLTITDAAAEKVKYFQGQMKGAADKLLRIAIRAGGCSGYSYDFVFDQKRDGDFEFPVQGTTVLVDPMSMNLLKGATIDYVESMQGAGFVVDNPNSTGGCGCGSSFSA